METSEILERAIARFLIRWLSGAFDRQTLSAALDDLSFLAWQESEELLLPPSMRFD